MAGDGIKNYVTDQFFVRILQKTLKNLSPLAAHSFWGFCLSKNARKSFSHSAFETKMNESFIRFAYITSIVFSFRLHELIQLYSFILFLASFIPLRQTFLWGIKNEKCFRGIKSVFDIFFLQSWCHWFYKNKIMVEMCAQICYVIFTYFPP